MIGILSPVRNDSTESYDSEDTQDTIESVDVMPAISSTLLQKLGASGYDMSSLGTQGAIDLVTRLHTVGSGFIIIKLLGSFELQSIWAIAHTIQPNTQVHSRHCKIYVSSRAGFLPHLCSRTSHLIGIAFLVEVEKRRFIVAKWGIGKWSCARCSYRHKNGSLLLRERSLR